MLFVLVVVSNNMNRINNYHFDMDVMTSLKATLVPTYNTATLDFAPYHAKPVSPIRILNAQILACSLSHTPSILSVP